MCTERRSSCNSVLSIVQVPWSRLVHVPTDSGAGFPGSHALALLFAPTISLIARGQQSSSPGMLNCGNKVASHPTQPPAAGSGLTCSEPFRLASASHNHTHSNHLSAPRCSGSRDCSSAICTMANACTPPCSRLILRTFYSAPGPFTYPVHGHHAIANVSPSTVRP